MDADEAAVVGARSGDRPQRGLDCETGIRLADVTDRLHRYGSARSHGGIGDHRDHLSAVAESDAGRCEAQRVGTEGPLTHPALENPDGLEDAKRFPHISASGCLTNPATPSPGLRFVTLPGRRTGLSGVDDMPGAHHRWLRPTGAATDKGSMESRLAP